MVENSTSKHTTKKARKGFKCLNKTPSTSKLLGLDHFVAKNLARVEVGTKKETVDTSTNGITMEARHPI